jgi:hypothetical protein
VDNNTQQNNNFIAGAYFALISALRLFIAGIRRNIVLFLICIIGTTGLVIFYFSKDKNSYDFSFTVSYDELVRKVYGDRIVKLNTIVKENDYSRLANLLSVDQKTASALINIKAKNIVGDALEKDMNTDKIPFVVTCRVTDTATISKLQTGIVSFLEEGNKYLSSKMAIKIKEIDNEISFIDSQLTMMDNLKKEYQQFAEDASPSTKEKTSPSGLYEFSYELYKKRQDLIKKKEMPSNLQVIDDAIVPRPAKKSIVMLSIVGIILGFVVYTIVIGIVIPVFRKEP